MYVTHIVARLVFPQTVEVEIVIHDFATCLSFQVTLDAGIQRIEHDGRRVNEYLDLVDEPFFVAYQTERVALADRQRADRQHRTRHGGEFHVGLARLPGREHRDGEPFVVVSDRQIAACRGGRCVAGIVDGHPHLHRVAYGHTPVGHIDGCGE